MGKLRYVLQLMCLARGVLLGAARQSKEDWLVVSGNVELPTFNKETEVLHCFVNCQQLPVESAVASFSVCQLSQKVGNGTPLSVYLLLQNCSNGHIRGVCYDASWGIGLGVK